MISSNRRWLSGLAAAVVLFPTSVGGQTVAQSFDELQQIPNAGHVAIITDGTGSSPVAPAPVRAAEAGAGNQADEWHRVDVLQPGTRIVVTLKTGEKRICYFRWATEEDVTIAVGRAGGQEPIREETLPKSLIGMVATFDPVKDGVRRGALVGAGGLLALVQVFVTSCGTGCENDMPQAAALAVGALGAGVGSLVGLLADLDAGRSDVLFPTSAASGQSRSARTSRFFPAHPWVRVGPVYGQAVMRSALVKGSLGAPGFALAVQISPHISAHIEYTATIGRFYPPSGSVPDSILQNVVSTSARVAGDR